MKAKGSSPAGPWIKQKSVVPFYTKLDTYYSETASPGHVIKDGDEYLQFFSSTTRKPGNRCGQRTLGIARTKDLDGPWTMASRSPGWYLLGHVRCHGNSLTNRRWRSPRGRATAPATLRRVALDGRRQAVARKAGANSASHGFGA